MILGGPLINFLVNRRQQRLAALVLRNRQERGFQKGQQQSNWRRIEPYGISRRKSKEQPIPLFGASPGEFGLDWAYVKPRKVTPLGYQVGSSVSRPTWNRSGSTVNLKPDIIYKKSELESSRRKLSTERTNIRPIPKGGSTVTNWDGKVRNVPSKQSYLTTERKAEKRAPEPSINQDPYSFY